MLSGFNRLTDAISEMRNDNGPVAHGKDGFLDAVAADHARAFLHAGDAILSVLLNALEAKEPDIAVTREPYDRFDYLHARIDEAVAVGARVDEEESGQVLVVDIATGGADEQITLRLQPSRLLYGVDRLAYIEVLKTAGPPQAIDEETEAEEQPAQASEIVALRRGPVASPIGTVIGTYEGDLAVLRASLDRFLADRGLPVSIDAPEEPDLNDSLLLAAEKNIGLDWRERDTLRAALRVSSKRVLSKFDVVGVQADEVSEAFISWLAANEPG